MDISFAIKHKVGILELCFRYSSLKWLEDATPPQDELHRWYEGGREHHSFMVMFIGKTGYGKSTTINTMTGLECFQTNEISSCTKELQCADYVIRENPYSKLLLCDLPGIGESTQADKTYLEWYKESMSKTDCVVYILRADQRDFALDQTLFLSLFPSDKERARVIVALNFADKVEPVNRSTRGLTQEQMANLNVKCDTVSRLFNISKDHIVFYSAKDNIQLDNLVQHISNMLRRSVA